MKQAATDLGLGLTGISHERVDWFGLAASSLCAVHCAVSALLPAAFGVLGLEILLAHQAEWVFTLVAVAFAAGALALGWRRHRSTWIMAWLVLGILGLLVSRGLESGSAHHGHHGDLHHSEAANATPAEDGSAVRLHEHRAESTAHPRSSAALHDQGAHIAGTAVGALAGVALLIGHAFNIRSTRRLGERI